MKTSKKQQKLVDDWNAKHPIGTPVTRYKLMNPLEDGKDTFTRSGAWVLCGHTAVLMVEGVSGCVCLESVRVQL